MKTKLSKDPKKLFQVWMMEESDLIQATSKAYGERICLEQMYAAKDSEARDVVKKLTSLFGYSLVCQDLVFYGRKGILSSSQTQQILDFYNQKIKAFMPFVEGTVKALGVEEHMIFAPIAKDWKAFNALDNRGELLPKARL